MTDSKKIPNSTPFQLYDWEQIAVSLSYVFKRKITVDLDKSGFACFYDRGLSICLLKHDHKKSVIYVSFRASLPPSTAGLISVILANVCAIMVDEEYELDDNGRMLLGKEAMEYVWVTRPKMLGKSKMHEKFLKRQKYLPH